MGSALKFPHRQECSSRVPPIRAAAMHPSSSGDNRPLKRDARILIATSIPKEIARLMNRWLSWPNPLCTSCGGRGEIV